MSEDLKRVEDKIDNNFRGVYKKLDDMNREITTHKVKIENCEDGKSSLEEEIYGNGRAGLKLEVDRIKNALKTTGIIKRSMWTNIGIIFTCVGVAAGVTFSYLTYTKNNTSDKVAISIEKKDIE